jgi:hypothetical protein
MRGLRIFGIVVAVLGGAGLPSAARSQLNLGLEAGYFGGNKDAVEGFPSTRFDSTVLLGGRLGYLVAFRSGLGIGIDAVARGFETPLKEGSVDFGELRVRPITLGLSLAYRPPGGSGLGGRIGLGFGVAPASFNHGSALQALERQNGVRFTIRNEKPGFAFDMPLGLDYFVAPWLSLGAEARLLVVRVETKWTVSGPAASVPVQDIEAFVAVSGELVVGARLWIPGT